MTYSPYEISVMDHEARVMDQIDANQRAFDDAGRSWKRLIPFWLLRRRYTLLMENEALFASIGITLEPLDFKSVQGRSADFVRKMIGA